MGLYGFTASALTVLALTAAEHNEDQLSWEKPACLNFWAQSASIDGPVAVREMFSVPQDLGTLLKPVGYSNNADAPTTNGLPSDLSANVTWPPQSTIPVEQFMASAARNHVQFPLGEVFASGGAEVGEYLPSSWGPQGTMVRSQDEALLMNKSCQIV